MQFNMIFLHIFFHLNNLQFTGLESCLYAFLYSTSAGCWHRPLCLGLPSCFQMERLFLESREAEVQRINHMISWKTRQICNSWWLILETRWGIKPCTGIIKVKLNVSLAYIIRILGCCSPQNVIWGSAICGNLGKERSRCVYSQEMIVTSALPMTWKLEPLGWWQKPTRQLDGPISLPVDMKPTEGCKSVRTLRGWEIWKVKDIYLK